MSDRIGKSFHRLVGHVRNISNRGGAKETLPPTPRGNEKLELKKQTRNPIIEKNIKPARNEWGDGDSSESEAIMGYHNARFLPETESELLGPGGPVARYEDEDSLDGARSEELSIWEEVTRRGHEEPAPREEKAQSTSTLEAHGNAPRGANPELKVPRLTLPEPQSQRPPQLPQSPRTPWTRAQPPTPRTAATEPSGPPRPRSEAPQPKEPQTPRWSAARPSKGVAERTDVDFSDLPPISPRVENDPSIDSVKLNKKKS